MPTTVLLRRRRAEQMTLSVFKVQVQEECKCRTNRFLSEINQEPKWYTQRLAGVNYPERKRDLEGQLL